MLQTKMIAALIVTTLLGFMGGTIVTVHYITNDFLAAVRDDQAPVRAQAKKDIQNMRDELRARPHNSPSSWR